MTVHYELPTTADFAALAGPHQPVDHHLRVDLARRERARTRGGRREERVRRGDRTGQGIRCLERASSTALRRRARRRSSATSSSGPASPDRSRSSSRPASARCSSCRTGSTTPSHVGSHFTLGQLLRAPSQDQEAYAVTVSANEWTLWHATPTDRAAQIARRSPRCRKNVDDATNREAGEARHAPRSADTATAARARRTAVPTSSTSTRSASPTRCARSCRCTTPTSAYRCSSSPPSRLLSGFMERARNDRRDRRPCRARPIGSAHPRSMRPCASSSPRLNVNEAETALHGLAEGSAGRVERDLAAIGRLAADGAVETALVRLHHVGERHARPRVGCDRVRERERRGRERCSDGTHAGDLLPQLALLVISKGGKVVTVRSDDLDGGGLDRTGDGRAQVRAGLTRFAPTAGRPAPDDGCRRCGRVRRPAVGACRCRLVAQRPGPRGS